MKRTIKKYHLKESIQYKLIYIFFGILACIGAIEIMLFIAWVENLNF